MSSFQIKPKVNKNFKKLDLFLDDNFYDTVEPIIITLDKPLRIVPQDSEGNILEPIEPSTDVAFEITQFVIPKSDLEELLKKAPPGKTLSFEFGDLNETVFIDIDSLSYDFKNNPTEKVMEILSRPIYKENCLFFTSTKCNIFSSKKTLNSYLNNTIHHLLRNLDINSDIFLGTIKPKEFNPMHINQALSYPAEFNTMKKNLKENFEPFLKEAIVENSAKSLVLNSPNFREHQFNNIWLQTKEIQREKHIFNVLNKSQSNDLISKEFLFDLQKSIISKQLSVKKQPDTTQAFLKSIDNLSFNQKQELFTSLKQETGDTHWIKTIKELLETVKGSHYQIETQDDSKVVAKINWKAITYQKFPNIECHLLPFKLDDLLEVNYKDLKISKFNLYQRYETVNNLVIHKIFEHLEQASNFSQLLLNKSVNSTYDEENPCPFVYLKNDELFFEISFPQEIPIKETEKFIKIVIDGINIENFKEPERINAAILNSVISLKMDYNKDKMDNDEDNERDINDIGFKI